MIPTLDTKKTRRTATQIMVISGLYLVAVAAWMITALPPVMAVMEAITVWAAVVLVLLMAELARASSEKTKASAVAALALTACMAAVTVANHFVYFTVLDRIFPSGAMPSWLRLDGWPSVSKALECASWGFLLGLAMLFSAPVLRELGTPAMAWTMRVSGALTLAGLIGPLTGNMAFYNLSTAGYSAGFFVLSIQMAARFRAA